MTELQMFEREFARSHYCCALCLLCRSQYIMLCTDVAISGLPAESFSTKEYKDDGKTLNMTLNWAWMEDTPEKRKSMF